MIVSNMTNLCSWINKTESCAVLRRNNNLSFTRSKFVSCSARHSFTCAGHLVILKGKFMLTMYTCYVFFCYFAM